MKEFIEFYKEVVYTCNNSTCNYCPIRKIRKVGELCMPTMFNYFIEKNGIVVQKIYDEFARLNLDIIPNLNFYSGKEVYESQLEILKRYCKNNNLEIE